MLSVGLGIAVNCREIDTHSFTNLCESLFYKNTFAASFRPDDYKMIVVFYPTSENIEVTLDSRSL